MGHFSRYFLFVVIFIISGCTPRNTKVQPVGEGQIPGSYNLKGKIVISGAYALTPLARSLAEGYSKLNPGVMFEIEATGTGAGLEAGSNGAVHIAMVSRPLTDEEMATGLFAVPVAKDAVVLIANPENPYLPTILEKGFDPGVLSKLYKGDGQMTWGELLGADYTEPANLYSRSDISGAAALWAGFLNTTQSGLKGMPASGDTGMLRMIRNDKFSLGYCNLVYAYDNATRAKAEGVQVVPIDLDYDKKITTTDDPYGTLDKLHRAIYLGLYPHGLCRKLSFVTMGVPKDELILDFLRWSLTEGQALVSPSGYCEFNGSEKKVSLELLN